MGKKKNRQPQRPLHDDETSKEEVVTEPVQEEQEEVTLALAPETEATTQEVSAATPADEEVVDVAAPEASEEVPVVEAPKETNEEVQEEQVQEEEKDAVAATGTSTPPNEEVRACGETPGETPSKGEVLADAEKPTETRDFGACSPASTVEAVSKTGSFATPPVPANSLLTNPDDASPLLNDSMSTDDGEEDLDKHSAAFEVASVLAFRIAVAAILFLIQLWQKLQTVPQVKKLYVRVANDEKVQSGISAAKSAAVSGYAALKEMAEDKCECSTECFATAENFVKSVRKEVLRMSEKKQE